MFLRWCFVTVEDISFVLFQVPLESCLGSQLVGDNIPPKLKEIFSELPLKKSSIIPADCHTCLLWDLSGLSYLLVDIFNF